jgi:hypothetical protein
MKTETLKNILGFLGRVNLTGNEAPALVEAAREIQMEISARENPAPENSEKNSPAKK